MKRYGLLMLALSALLSGAWRQAFPQTLPGGMRIQPATRTYPLEHPLGRLKWDRNGYLIHHHASADPQPLIWVYTAEGQLVGCVSPARALTDARRISLKDVAVTKRGTILVATTVRSKKDALASALFEFDLQGKLERIIKTDPFVPRRIALDGDGNMWMFGYDWQRLDKDDNWAQVHKLSSEDGFLSRRSRAPSSPRNSTLSIYPALESWAQIYTLRSPETGCMPGFPESITSPFSL